WREGRGVVGVRRPPRARLRELRIGSWIDADGMRALWRASSLGELVVLPLGPCSISSYHHTHQGGLDDLGDGQAMPALERFTFGYEGRSHVRVEGKDLGVAVAGAPPLGRLRELLLSENEVGGDGAPAPA